MKHCLTAIVIGLLIIGCEEAKKPAPATGPAPDPAQMQKMMTPNSATPSGTTEEKKEEEKKPEAPADGEKAPAEGEKPAVDAPK